MILKDASDYGVEEVRETETPGSWQKLSLQDVSSKTGFGNRMRSVADNLERHLGDRAGRI